MCIGRVDYRVLLYLMHTRTLGYHVGLYLPNLESYKIILHNDIDTSGL